MTKQAPRKLSPLMIGVFVVSAIVGAIGGRQVVKALMGASSSTASVQDALAQSVDEMNRGLPMMVDEFTRLDSTEALPDRKILYRYTILNMQPLPGRDEIVSSMRPVTLAHYKSAPEMAELRRMKVALVYCYSDAQGNELARFEIQHDDAE